VLRSLSMLRVAAGAAVAMRLVFSLDAAPGLFFLTPVTPA
jgi:hypothetical protein